MSRLLPPRSSYSGMVAASPGMAHKTISMRASAEIVTRQLLLMHTLSGADGIGRLYADEQLRAGVVNPAGDSARAARVGFTAAGDAFRRLDSHDDLVAIDDTADPHRYGLALGPAVRQWDCSDGRDFY
jgi:hypothetical protein